MQIGFIGLGKLGLPYAEAVAKCHEVDGYDIEPRSSRSINVVSTMKEVVQDKSIVFIVLPTPHDSRYDGSAPTYRLPLKDFCYDVLCQGIADVAKVARSDQTICTVSTVLPGTIRREVAQFAGNLPLR